MKTPGGVLTNKKDTMKLLNSSLPSASNKYPPPQTHKHILNVRHHLFLLLCSFSQTLFSLLTLTHLATVSSIYTCSVPVSFFFLTLAHTLPVTPPSLTGRKVATVHRPAARGHRARLSQLSQETERDWQGMYSVCLWALISPEAELTISDFD